jgi:uncharacterized protein (TIGR00255 family)
MHQATPFSLHPATFFSLFHMTILSMTGYASAQAQLSQVGFEGVRIGIEIRSVNSRFLDLSFKMNDDLRSHEPALRELFMRVLKRGKVEAKLSLDHQDPSVLPKPTDKFLQEIVKIQEIIFAHIPNATPLSVNEVIKLNIQGSQTPPEIRETLIELTHSALAQLVQARATEGKRLVDSLLERIQQLKALAHQASPLIPQLIEQQRQRFLDRWQEAMSIGPNQVNADTAQDRAMSEATAFAIRIDVAEELTRLSSHLTEIESCLTQKNLKEGVGKRLDFLIQELHRESNTLGSKSTTMELSKISVDMKVLIEQMREQVQNLE